MLWKIEISIFISHHYFYNNSLLFLVILSFSHLIQNGPVCLLNSSKVNNVDKKIFEMKLEQVSRKCICFDVKEMEINLGFNKTGP